LIKLRSHQSRALDKLKSRDKGCVYVPTGGGKTIIMLEDLVQRLQSADSPQTVVIVAPRILLAGQLCSEFLEYIDGNPDFVFNNNYNILHVHSGETVYDSSTKSDYIKEWVIDRNFLIQHSIIFSTYHSLGRVVDSKIDVDVLYCDEAHNATQKHHFVGVAATSTNASNSYFFTATPKYTRGGCDRGMNNVDVFGNTLISVPAPELIKNGSIIPPKLVVHETEHVRTKYNAQDVDRQMVLEIIDDLDDEQSAKVLVAAPNTKVLWNMLSQTDILHILKCKGYDILHITSKHGAYINRKKVGRDKFFQTLTDWGRDDDKKFIVFHYSILSEGINVPGLTHTILLRNLPIIEMAQTIGRVIRLHKDDAKDIANGNIDAGNYNLYRKSHGVVTVPLCGKASLATRNRLQKIIELIFEDGLPAHSFAY
tara:strand:+ start:1135 stop:2406 length:1272 start_codon:yes stop_codon:yes gene_type:complete